MSREEKRHEIEVHVAGLCFRETSNDIEILIIKRQENRELYPGKWECGGGQVYRGENFQEAVARQIKEELGVVVRKVLVFGTYEIITPNLDQKKIPGVKFICFWESYANGNSPRIDEKEHSQWEWRSINKLADVDFIPGLKEDIRIGWEFYANNKNVIER